MEIVIPDEILQATNHLHVAALQIELDKGEAETIVVCLKGLPVYRCHC